ncbi:hypothetical protein [Clostridium beijerinckii]|uniref:hypothetical protein n=1 Tax=Clostridium beijerinckii TaxID=1520 RepID=UPI0015707021|nr:hypothetical protein [Clostridium beijerinckii]NRT73825.1 hypothetical protein [Clostridium beijerinckii]
MFILCIVFAILLQLFSLGVTQVWKPGGKSIQDRVKDGVYNRLANLDKYTAPKDKMELSFGSVDASEDKEFTDLSFSTK